MTADAKRNALTRSWGFYCSLLVALGTAAMPVVAMAQPASETEAPSKIEGLPASNAPTEITKALQDIDTAANQQQVKRLLRFYSADFTHSDGLNRSSLKQSLKAFWKEHQDLQYKTQLLSWEAKGNGGGIATTKTTITGKRTVADRQMVLTATIHSHQRWLNEKITEQTITAEESQLVSGESPPKITVTLPTEVKAGESFNFDVVVKEPLGDRLLLGTAIEEPISAERYQKQPEVKLALLPAGGLFKVGKAPDKPTSEWISAVLVQDGGMITISRRLTVVK